VIAAIIVAHLVGDYIVQSEWMASEKTKRWWPAIVHGVTYTLPFLFITQSWSALLVIAGTHIVIDHYRLARHVSWLKNQVGPRGSRPTWEDARATGYPSAKPAWMSVWLMIITDNTLHILINIGAVTWL
jgi:hypothetical protein